MAPSSDWTRTSDIRIKQSAVLPTELQRNRLNEARISEGGEACPGVNHLCVRFADKIQQKRRSFRLFMLCPDSGACLPLRAA